MASQDDILRRRRWVRARVRRARWRRGLVRPSGAAPDLGLAPDPRRLRGRQRGSLFLHQLGDFSAHAAAGLLAAGAVLGWLIFGAALGFPSWWVTVLDTVSASVTLIMVFAIQHTQSRQQSAAQRERH